jgi:hypothetical protein
MLRKNAEVSSLGKAQADIEAATKTLKAAQSTFTKASNALVIAQEGHERATLALSAVFQAVRGSSKVAPIGYK